MFTAARPSDFCGDGDDQIGYLVLALSIYTKSSQQIPGSVIQGAAKSPLQKCFFF